MLAIAVAVVGWIFAVVVNVQNARDKRDLQAAHERAMDWERARCDSLMAQIQANAQGFQHYPTLGPTEVAEERHFMRDDTGLIEFDVTHERDFEDVADF